MPDFSGNSFAEASFALDAALRSDPEIPIGPGSTGADESPVPFLLSCSFFLLREARGFSLSFHFIMHALCLSVPASIVVSVLAFLLLLSPSFPSHAQFLRIR